MAEWREELDRRCAQALDAATRDVVEGELVEPIARLLAGPGLGHGKAAVVQALGNGLPEACFVVDEEEMLCLIVACHCGGRRYFDMKRPGGRVQARCVVKVTWKGSR